MGKKDEIRDKIETEEDFIYFPKFSNSIRKLRKKYPDGVEFGVIAKALVMPVEDVVQRYEDFIALARKKLGVPEDAD